MSQANQTSQNPPPCALMMAGGTGGHIFPGLAVAEELRARGWRVHWLGTPGSMEEQLAPPRGFAFEAIEFGGVRGKGWRALLALPWRLWRALRQARAVVRRVRPDVLIGMGGYVTVPGALAGALCGKPLVLHEQNSVAGLSNRLLARLARRVFTAFPGALPRGEWVGNPLRSAFLQAPTPAERFAGRSGPLRLLVVGGSLGAKALNDIVPQALALLPEGERPQVLHQSGAKQIDALKAAYAAAGVQAETVPFIDDMAQAFADADWVICRAGAATVTELAAVGAAALFVPFPYAVDDHQSANARFLTDAGAGQLIQQADLTPQKLARLLGSASRSALLKQAQAAREKQKTGAAQAVADACQELRQP